MAKVRIFKTGNWDKVQRLVNAQYLISGIKAANELAMKNVASTGETMAVKFLQSQSLSWRPLSPTTLRRKLNREPAGSNKILMDTTNYFSKITSWTDKDMGYIGVRKTAKSSDGTTDVANIAAVLEYGSKARNIPARPLWSVVKKHLMMFIKTRKPFIEEIKKNLGR